jgi:hypothetical protein
MKRVAMGWMVAAALLAACATPSPESLKPGTSVQEVRALMGTEVASFALPNGGKRLEFRGNGADTYMVDIDASGKMVQAVQVRNEVNFRNIVPGMTREQVLMTLGQPNDVAPGGRQGGQVWSYNFRNTQCLWFQVAIGADGRTTGPGSMALLPPCARAPS